MTSKITYDTTIKFFISIIGLVFIVFVLKELSNIIIPFVVAYFLFFLYSPISNVCERKGFPSYVIVILEVILTIIIAWIISSLVIGSVIQFSNEVPGYIKKLNTIVQNTAISIGITDPFFKNFSLQGILDNIDYKLLAGGIFTSTFSVLGNVLIVLFFFVFVFTGHNTIYNAIKKRFVNQKVQPELKKLKNKYEKNTKDSNPDFAHWMGNKFNIEKNDQEEKLELTFKAITEQIQKYLVSKSAINLGAGIVVTIILSLFGIDFPIIWGLFVFLFNFIPALGSTLALLLPTLMALVQFESFGFALLIAVILAGIQSLFFSLIEPSVLGKKLNLNPLVILLAVLVWGYIWGIVGMLLSVPLTAIINIILSNSESRDLRFISDLMSKD
ncbi:MAG TPA: AI-2E family transporter [Ignavibacteria bacterium]|nr:AI-2E family transporter [Ignavibacteria bacterium]